MVGCKENPADLPPLIPSVASVAPVLPAVRLPASVPDPTDPTLATLQAVVPFEYRSGDRRDPFRSIIVPVTVQEVPKDLPPLQRRDLSELKLVGIAWGALGREAIIETADGKGYPVRVGMLIGLNKGSITQIGRREVMVEEHYVDIFGVSKTRVIIIELAKAKKEESL